MTDYLDKAVEAAQRAFNTSNPLHERKRWFEAAIKEAEPFIAEHHRADERARVEERLRPHLDELRDRLESTLSLILLDDIETALNSEADGG